MSTNNTSAGKRTSSFVSFGNSVTKNQLQKLGFEIEAISETQIRVGNMIEGPCSIKTPIKMIDKFGAFSYINGRGRFSDVSIGRYCSIAEKVSIGYPEHPTDWLSTSALQYMRPNWMQGHQNWQKSRHSTIKKTCIGDDVWIGAGAFLRTGITVGTGAIIGAQAVVVKDVPPYAVVAGNPAKVIKYRVPVEFIAPLLKSKWWKYSPTQLDGCSFHELEKAIMFIEHLNANHTPAYEGPKVTITEQGAILSTLPD